MYLLDRLYQLPKENGKITIGGVDIQDIDLSYLRKNIGIVLQEPFLFSKSFRESIADGAPRADLETVRHYARMAVIDDAITGFAQGYETPIGERGVTISGGQKQRVAIARALAKNPKLLLCDEPTGALDYVTGKAILKLLQDTCRQQGMTVIVITHNTAIAPMADKVIHVKNGQVEQIDLNPNPLPVEEIEW